MSRESPSDGTSRICRVHAPLVLFARHPLAFSRSLRRCFPISRLDRARAFTRFPSRFHAYSCNILVASSLSLSFAERLPPFPVHVYSIPSSHLSLSNDSSERLTSLASLSFSVSFSFSRSDAFLLQVSVLFCPPPGWSRNQRDSVKCFERVDGVSIYFKD